MQEPELRPFQKQIVDIIDTEDTKERLIHWIYDLDGNKGKNKVLVPYLQRMRGAFLADPTAKRSIMDQITRRTPRKTPSSSNAV